MDENMIVVSDVSKAFKLPHERQTSIKGLVINLFRGRKTYEKQQVLKNINIEIKKGEFFGIVGRNGGGKSTLLKLLAGIYSPDKGFIQVNGKLTPFIELGVGFNPELTGRENIYLNGALLGFSVKEVKIMYQDIVAFAELDKFMDQKLKNYSSGMQVRLAFSIAIRAQSDILLLDEVLAVGDAAFQQKCFDYFEELKLRKQTVVFVSHDMGAIRRFCTRAVYVNKGRIIKEGSPSDIADLYAESNIKTQDEERDTEVKIAGPYKVGSRIVRQSEEEVILEVSYRSLPKDKVYIGLAVVKDGVSVGEITTSHKNPLSGKGKVGFTLPKAILNGGTYQISGITLFRQENRELVAIDKEKNEFVVKGNDVRRGGAIKLPDGWVYEDR